MDTLVLAHTGLTLALFLCINWIGKHSISAGYIQMSMFVKTDEAPAFNFLYRTFAPVVFITIASAILYTIKLDWIVNDIYMVVVYHSLFRLAYVVSTGRARLLNWRLQATYIVVSVGVAYYVYTNLIVDRAFFFPEPKDIGNALWIGVIGFIYHTCNSIRLSEKKTIQRKDNYLATMFRTFKGLYNDTIEKSVELGTKKIVAKYKSLAKDGRKTHKYYMRRLVLRDYNPDDNYIDEVSRIYDALWNHFYTGHEDTYDESEHESCEVFNE